MSKVKTTFFCQKCGTAHAKWQGQCNGCKEWNTLVEEVIEKPKEKGWIAPKTSKSKGAVPIRIQEIDTDKESRISTNDSELNRVLWWSCSRFRYSFGWRTRNRKIHFTPSNFSSN